MSDAIRFYVPAAMVVKCATFAVSVEQSQRQFGSQDQRQRGQMILDTFEGKLAEVAFAQLAAGYGYKVALDFDLYAVGQTDNGSDVTTITRGGETRLVSAKVDVKGIGSRSSWLLVESHKFGADLYVLVRHQLSRERLNQMILVDRELEDIPVEVVGFAHRAMFTAPDGLPYVELVRGERLRVVPEMWQKERPDTVRWLATFRQSWAMWQEMGPRLDAPKNVGLYAKWLSRDFGYLLSYLWNTAIPEDPMAYHETTPQPARLGRAER
jgi:hypothetical protein